MKPHHHKCKIGLSSTAHREKKRSNGMYIVREGCSISFHIIITGLKGYFLKLFQNGGESKSCRSEGHDLSLKTFFSGAYSFGHE
jgi:hypothetical protein